ncbi:MAG: NADH-quinone oxidoreductase subunit C [Ignavibacteriae bacterium]|nr:NADH-quinone oxidoreductase subunit C [Ignavibacteriota bacterium]
MINQIVIEKLNAKFPESLEGTNEFRNDLTVQVRKQDIVRVCEFLKTDPDLSFDMVIDLCGSDMYRPEGRFEVIYNLYSLKNKSYLRLKVLVDEDPCEVDSVTGVWSGANWHERETYDMFGIVFKGHPDLRRMYMTEDYEYYPLRKDFPLMGVPDSIPLPRK